MKSFIDTKKLWIVGIKNYKLLYWKTTDSSPSPTVRPRLNIKEGELSLATL